MPQPAWFFICSLFLAHLSTLPLTVSAQDLTPESSTATLEVVGRAGVAVQPDLAQIAFSVETSDRQAAKAMADNARRTETLLKALRDLMTDGDQLQTASVNLQPIFGKDDRLQPTGYRASNRVALETRQLERIGAFIDAAAASGAGQINSLAFRSSREAEHRVEAAVLAVGQARSDAERLARAAGAALGRVLRMRYAPQGPPGVFYEKATLAVGRTPVEIGDLTIEAEVLMVFELP
jgi:uncharacterized protein YggE